MAGGTFGVWFLSLVSLVLGKLEWDSRSYINGKIEVLFLGGQDQGNKDPREQEMESTVVIHDKKGM